MFLANIFEYEYLSIFKTIIIVVFNNNKLKIYREINNMYLFVLLISLI